ncbi:MAG TPA: zinc-dependent metalloprotease [Burkholderiaceae bacterium]|nr:zinc-dependent metalloprotease [Burkholderiaceae bacterium]
MNCISLPRMCGESKVRYLLAFACAALLSACATMPTGTAPAAAGAAAGKGAVTTTTAGAATPTRPTGTAAGAPAPSVAVPGAPRPFAEVIKDAKPINGLFTVWQKDDKTWIEIPPELMDQPFFLSIGLTRGLGERWLIGGLQGGSHTTGGEYIGQFRKAAGNVQLLARNTRFVARSGSPEERAVRNAYADSLLASAPIVSAPHPERKSVLIEATALLLNDIPRASHVIEREYRNSFSFDPRNSFIRSAKADAERTVFDITAHYAQPRIPLPAPPLPVPGAMPMPFYPAPDLLEDPRSLFLGFLYTFSKLPDKPMAARAADSRIGHFTTSKFDFSSESRLSPMRHYVQRWRLEKKDPQAAVSEPVKPITYWLSNEIPEKYRTPIRDGVLEWNKAFEKLGFKDAVVVRQQPDDSDVDLLETGTSSIRWQITARPSYGAIGPSHVDPRTGEILDADLGWDANFVRSARFLRSEEIGYRSVYDEASGDIAVEPSGIGSGAHCMLRELAMRELGYTLALLEVRGEIEPDSPQAEAFIDDFIRWVTMHEVGHTLGLTHNFRASTINTPKQLADVLYTSRTGLIGSVMDYPPANIALKGEVQGQYYASALGAYDYWAIEYAYKSIAPEQEATELATIAARASDPQLAFATDADAAAAIDPTANIWDLGSDPLAFYRKRALLTQELWQRLESRTMMPGESYAVLRRRFLSGLSQSALAMTQAAKYVGGAEIQNDAAGSPRLPITPTSAAQQREALAVITAGLFKSDSFKVSPQFLRKLASDRLEREELPFTQQVSMFEIALPDRVLAVQRDVLNRLMGPVVARRVLVNAEMAGKGSDAFTLSELYSTLQLAIWAEARNDRDATVLRRNLQREHLRRITGAILGPSAGYPADARALMRQNARQLHGWLVAAAARPGLSAETRAHFAEAAETLGEALKAPLIRTGV